MGAVRPFRQAGEMWYLQDSIVEELVIRHDGVSLAATYSPAGDTVVVALHGAGAGTRDYFLYRHLHNLLPPLGIGVVTFDRRGEVLGADDDVLRLSADGDEPVSIPYTAIVRGNLIDEVN